MKKKFNRYLSHRVLLLTLAAAAFFGCFLIAAAVIQRTYRELNKEERT